MAEPTVEAIRALMKDKANTKTRHVINAVNIDAMKTVMILRKLLSAFLLTHEYPAFRHVTDVEMRTEDVVGSVVKKRKVTKSSYIACVTDVDGRLDDDVTMTEGSNNKLPGPDYVRLSCAKPSKMSERMWGPIEHIPNASGLFVPYVFELAVADSVTVPTLVSTYFLRSLAPTVTQMFAVLDSIRSSWGIIETSGLGHEISHLCRCIDIALQAQAAVYPIYTHGIYEGSVIYGAGYSVCFRGRSIEPIAYTELQKEVGRTSTHSRSIETIKAKANDDDTRTAIDGATTMRELSIVVRSMHLDESQKQEILGAAYGLCYHNKYWSTSPVFIMKSLEYLQNEVEIPSDVPMYPRYLFSQDRMELVMSAFGHQAYTFMIPNGAKCELESADDPPKNFHVRTIAIESAVLDMRYAMEHGYVTNNMHSLSSKHRDMPLNGSTKKEVWDMLRDVHRGWNHEGDGEVAITRVAETGGGDITDDIW
jgi:hypothetical protein